MHGGARAADVDGGKRLLRIGGRGGEQAECGERCPSEEARATNHDDVPWTPTPVGRTGSGRSVERNAQADVDE
jgi:hypothetical protein